MLPDKVLVMTYTFPLDVVVIPKHATPSLGSVTVIKLLHLPLILFVYINNEYNNYISGNIIVLPNDNDNDNNNYSSNNNNNNNNE